MNLHYSAVETSFSFIYPSAVRLYMCVRVYSQVLFIKIAWFNIININENQIILTEFARLELFRLSMYNLTCELLVR